MRNQAQFACNAWKMILSTLTMLKVIENRGLRHQMGQNLTVRLFGTFSWTICWYGYVVSALASQVAKFALNALKTGWNAWKCRKNWEIREKKFWVISTNWKQILGQNSRLFCFGEFKHSWPMEWCAGLSACKNSSNDSSSPFLGFGGSQKVNFRQQKNGHFSRFSSNFALEKWDINFARTALKSACLPLLPHMYGENQIWRLYCGKSTQSMHVFPLLLEENEIWPIAGVTFPPALQCTCNDSTLHARGDLGRCPVFQFSANLACWALRYIAVFLIQVCERVTLSNVSWTFACTFRYLNEPWQKNGQGESYRPLSALSNGV